MIVQGGPLNVGGGPAVVVDHGHPVAGLQQLRRLDLIGPVGVHHHGQGAGVGDEQGLLGGEEAVLILRQGRKPVDELLGRGRRGLFDDVDGNAVFPAQGAHARRRTDTVVVRGAVAHDEHLGGVGHQSGQGVGHDPALHLGALLCLFGAAAVELEGELVADDGLIAAPGQGHVDGQVGKLEQLPIGLPVLAHADGQCGVDTAGVDHLMDGVQNVKLVFDKFGQILFIEDEEIAFPLIAAEHTARLGHPLVQAGVDLGHQGRALVLRQVFHQLVIVVQQQHGGHGAGGLILVPDEGELGHVHPIGRGQKAAAAAPGAHQMAKDQKPAAAILHLGGALVFALHEPPGVEAGDEGGQLGIEQMLPLAGELEKTVVGPDDVVALRAEDDHGQGGVGHGVFGGGVHRAGDVFQIAGDLPAAAIRVLPAVDRQGQDHGQFDHGQGDGEKSGDQGEQDQTDEIQLKAGLKQPRKFPVQWKCLLS